MTITKKLLLSSLSVLAVSTLAAPTVSADDAALELSANTAIVSDYRFRGLSLSDKDIAIQGGLDLTTKSGFYVGTWASSIETFAGSETELDIYAGYGFEASGLSFDVGVLAYTYPGSMDTTYLEAYGSVGGSVTEELGWTFGMAYAFDQDSLGGQDNLYIYGDLEYDVADSPMSFTAHLGRETGAFGKAASKAKIDWSLGAAFSVSDNVSFGVSYVDTNVSGIGSGGAVISLSASF